MKNLKLAAGRADFSRSVIDVSGVKIGGEFVVIAGPCSVESEEQTVRTAIAVKKAGAKMLRGGAFKPRTSPYAVQGLGRKGLKILDKARKETGLPIVTEVVGYQGFLLVGEYADVLQIGPRNCRLFSLLGRWASRGTDSAQARHVFHPGGMAELRRIHPRRRKSQCSALRTRHPHLRNLYPEHPRSLHDSRGAQGKPPAHFHRSEPRHGYFEHDRTHESGCPGGRCRRARNRGAHRSILRLERQGPATLPGPIRASYEKTRGDPSLHA